MLDTNIPIIGQGDFAAARMNDAMKAKLARAKRLTTLQLLAGREWHDFVADYYAEYECASGEAENEADRIKLRGEQIADKIAEMYELIPNREVFVDYAESALEAVTEAMKDQQAARVLDAYALVQFFKSHNIDIQQERDLRKERLANQA